MWGRKDGNRAELALRAAGDREADRLFAEVDRMGGMGPRPEPAPGPAGTTRGAEADREAGQ